MKILRFNSFVVIIVFVCFSYQETYSQNKRDGAPFWHFTPKGHFALKYGFFIAGTEGQVFSQRCLTRLAGIYFSTVVINHFFPDIIPKL